MGKRKISHAAYAAWDYKKEIEDLNKKSQEGWQLVKGGCFKSIYEQNDQACYRYQLDYNTDIENKVLYLEMFEDQGWEYINSTFNGWHFFRKPYDPELPEEEYEIYTDSSAIPDMERRWVRLAYSFMAVISAFLVITREIRQRIKEYMSRGEVYLFRSPALSSIIKRVECV